MTAWELARTWPDADLVVIDGSGHTGGEAMSAAVRAGARRLRERILADC